MRRLLLFTTLSLLPLSTAAAQVARLHHEPIDSIKDGCNPNLAPVFNRNRFYLLICPDTLALYDINSKRMTRLGAGGWAGLVVSHDGSFLAFSRRMDGGKTPYIWTLPLNPASGMPSGPPRRASMSSGNAPAISPDGKSIAFATDSDHTRLTVVPAVGGQERDLYKGPGDVWNVSWARNGATIYFASSNPAPSGPDEIIRVSASGGTAMRIKGDDVWFNGLSADGNHLLAEETQWPYDDLVLDTLGHRLTPTLRDTMGGPGWDGIGPDRRLAPDVVLAGNKTTPTILREFNFETMRIDAIPLPEVSYAYRDIQWSPDGKRFAAIQHDRGMAIVIASSNGTREFSTPTDYGWLGARLAWSPDGARLAYLTGLVGQTNHLMVKDIGAGTLKELPVSGMQVWAMRWTADGRRILYASAEPSDSGNGREVGETGIDGRTHVVRRLNDRHLEVSVFASDTTVIATNDSAAFVVSLASGSIRHIYGKRTGMPIVSPRGDLVAMRPLGKAGTPYQIEILRLDGTPVTTVTFPSTVGNGGRDNVVFAPDGKSLIATGRQTGGCCVVYQGYLDGQPSRKLFDAPSASGPPNLGFSPDGRRLVYSTGRGTIWEFELVTITGQGSR